MGECGPRGNEADPRVGAGIDPVEPGFLGEPGQETLAEFLKDLAIPDVAKATLAKLAPASYTGNAEQQARSI